MKDKLQAALLLKNYSLPSLLHINSIINEEKKKQREIQKKIDLLDEEDITKENSLKLKLEELMLLEKEKEREKNEKEVVLQTLIKENEVIVKKNEKTISDINFMKDKINVLFYLFLYLFILCYIYIHTLYYVKNCVAI
jgi:hypothetical protein